MSNLSSPFPDRKICGLGAIAYNSVISSICLICLFVLMHAFGDDLEAYPRVDLQALPAGN